MKCNYMYVALMDAIREDVSALTLLAEVLCLLDMIVNSFAHSISTKPGYRYSRPELTGICLSLTIFPQKPTIISSYAP